MCLCFINAFFKIKRLHKWKERAVSHFGRRAWHALKSLKNNIDAKWAKRCFLNFQQKMHTELFLLKGWELAANHFKKNNRKSAPKLITSIFVCHTSHMLCLGRQNYSGGYQFYISDFCRKNRWMVLKSDTSLASNKKVSCTFIFKVSKWLSQCNARWTVQHIKSGQ